MSYFPERRSRTAGRRGDCADGWHECLEDIARANHGAPVSVEVLGASDAGERVERRRALRGMSFRHAEDVLELCVGAQPSGAGALRYFIPAPRRMEVRREGERLEIVVWDALGTRTLIRLYGQPGGPDLLAQEAPR